MNEINIAYEPIYKLKLTQCAEPSIELPFVTNGSIRYVETQPLRKDLLVKTKFMFKDKLYVVRHTDDKNPCECCALYEECKKYSVVKGICQEKDNSDSHINFMKVESKVLLLKTGVDNDNRNYSNYNADGINITIKDNKDGTKNIVFDSSSVVDMQKYTGKVVVNNNPSFESLCPYFERKLNGFDKISCIAMLYELARSMNLKHRGSKTIVRDEDCKYEIAYDKEMNNFVVHQNEDTAYINCSPRFITEEAAMEVANNPRLKYILDGALK